MSVSSGSSLAGDDDQDLLGVDEEELDFYAILNVPPDATADEITKAYRKRCLLFHPDRHTADEDKQTAERIFVQLKRAHETLIDPKQRAIYDALGLQGLDTHGWQLVSRSTNPDNIRREYEFLQRLRDHELMLQRTHPTSQFVVKTSLAGLFMREKEYRYGPQLLGLSISQSVDCALTNKDRFGLTGRVRAGNGRGDGSVGVTWKRNLSKWSLDNTITISSDVLSYSLRAGCNLGTRSMLILQPTLQWMPLTHMVQPGLAVVVTRQLLRAWQGSIGLNTNGMQSSLTTTILHTQNNHPKAVCNLTLSPANPQLRFVWFSRNPSSSRVTEMACTLSPFGIVPSIQTEGRFTRFGKLGCSLQFAFPACTLTARFKAKTGGAAYEWAIVLCDDKEELQRSVFFGVVVPLAVFQIGKVIFRPWIERVRGLFEETTENEVDVAKQEEAERVINLMRPTSDRIRKEEEDKHGVVIMEARYGMTDAAGSRAYPVLGDRSIDVSVPMQSMVHDSQLRIYATSKSQLPGFYDPAPGEQKVLLVKYRFRDEAHAVIIPDEVPLTIPLRAHRLDQQNGMTR